MNLEEFLERSQQGLPCVDDLTALCESLGISFTASPAGQPEMDVPESSLAEGKLLARLLRREPWRSQVIAAKGLKCGPPAQVSAAEPTREKVRLLELEHRRHGSAAKHTLDEWTIGQEDLHVRLAKFRNERPAAIIGLQWFDGSRWLEPHIVSLPEGVSLDVADAIDLAVEVDVRFSNGVVRRMRWHDDWYGKALAYRMVGDKRDDDWIKIVR